MSTQGARFPAAFAASTSAVQSWSRAAFIFALTCGRWNTMQVSGLCLESAIARSSRGLYSTMRPGSTPQLAVRMSFGSASSMRVASSLAAKPPNTTEWTAPMRAQASMATIASGIIGM